MGQTDICGMGHTVLEVVSVALFQMWVYACCDRRMRAADAEDLLNAVTIVLMLSEVWLWRGGVGSVH